MKKLNSVNQMELEYSAIKLNQQEFLQKFGDIIF